MDIAPISASPSWQEGLTVRDYLDIVRRRKALIALVFGSVMLVGLAAITQLDPVYRATTKLLVPPPPDARSQSVVDSRNPLGPILATTSPPSAAAQADEMTSASFLTAAKRAAGVSLERGDSSPSVRVETKQGGIIRIIVEGRDPDAVARLANTIADLHLERAEVVQTKGLRDALAFVRKELDTAAGELISAQERLTEFNRRYPVERMEAEQEPRARQSIELQTRFQQAKASLASAEAQVAKLKAQLAGEPREVAEEQSRENPQRLVLEERLRQLKVKRLELLQDFQPTAPEVVALEEQIRSTTAELDAEPEVIRTRRYGRNPKRDLLEPRLAQLEVDVVAHQEAYRAAQKALAGHRSAVPNLGPLKVRFQALTRELERAQTRYDTLLERVEDLEIRSNAWTPVVRVTTRAEPPPEPVWPPRVLLLAITTCCALGLSIGAAFLHAFLDDRLYSPEYPEQVCAVPTLGYVPKMRLGPAQQLRALPSGSPEAEAYRSLRSSISFAALDAPIRRLQVTSASQGDGKTLSAANLARVMAIDGRKVILVDTDMRRPQVHRVFGLPEAPGLAEFLNGTSSLDEIIYPTDSPNLSVICAGEIPPNPAELLGSPAWNELLTLLDERADLVIYDTPACLAVTDASMTAASMDGVVLVVRPGQTRRSDLDQMLVLLRRARARIIGTVFNQVQSGDLASYYRSCRYGYTARDTQPGEYQVLSPVETVAAPGDLAGSTDVARILRRTIQRMESLQGLARAVGDTEADRQLSAQMAGAVEALRAIEMAGGGAEHDSEEDPAHEDGPYARAG